MPNKPKPDDPAQSKRFIELATEAEPIDNKKAFDRAVKKVALSKREPPKRG